jgi:hypothetical protein
MPFGTVHHVGGRGEQIDSHRLDVDRNLAGGLGGIGVEDDAPGLGELADLGDGLDGADLVIGEHHRDQDGLRRDGLFELGRVDEPIRPYRDVGDLEALPLEPLADIHARPLLDRRGDDVVALLSVHLGHALERQVDGLRAPGGEDDLLGIPGADQLGDLVAGTVHRPFRFPAEGVIAARGVPEFLREVRNHRVEDPRVHRRRRLTVHEDRQFQGHRFSPLGSHYLISTG